MYQITKTNGNSEALENRAWTSHLEFHDRVLQITKGSVSLFLQHQRSYHTQPNQVAVSSCHRSFLQTALGDSVTVTVVPYQCRKLSQVTVRITCTKNNHQMIYLTEPQIRQKIPELLIQPGVSYLLPDNYIMTIKSSECGWIDQDTEILFEPTDQLIILSNTSKISKEFFQDDFDFTSLGVGGLNRELSTVFRRAFATWAISPRIFEKTGMKHEKGLLLHGPPGCGKTAIARALAQRLVHKPENIMLVNGPELMSKYVGESEQKVRDLFDRAIKHPEEFYIIILDEFDALVPVRGTRSGGTGTSDSVVTQFLTMIDGVNSHNNFLIIAMTNRKDQIDEAVLRDGRIGVHVHIGIPDSVGRKEIFQIHTQKLSHNQLLDSRVNFDHLVKLTQNYSGAEIEGVVRNASSRAIARLLSQHSEDLPCLTQDDFIHGIQEIAPMYGSSEIFNVNLEMTPLDAHTSGSILVWGPPKSGKTHLGVHFLAGQQLPHTNYINSASVIAYDERVRSKFLMTQIHKASESDRSGVLIDDLEIILDYSSLGGVVRFSNVMYQTIKTILKLRSPGMLLIMATSEEELFDNLSPEFTKIHRLINTDFELQGLESYNENFT